MGKGKKPRVALTAMEKMEKKLKEIDPYFVEGVYASNEDELNKKMGVYAKEMTSVENARDEDPDIKAKKEELRVLGSTYSEPLAAIKMKRKFIYKVLGDRGKLP